MAIYMYKHSRGFELGTTEKKSSKLPELDLNLGLLDCESDGLTSRPCCLQIFVFASTIWNENVTQLTNETLYTT